MADPKMKNIALLAECFPASTITDAMAATFLEVANDFPAELVSEACRDFRHGNDDRKVKTFLPSCAEFADHLRKLRARDHARERAVPEQKQITHIDPEQRRRVGRKMAELAKSLKRMPVSSLAPLRSNINSKLPAPANRPALTADLERRRGLIPIEPRGGEGDRR